MDPRSTPGAECIVLYASVSADVHASGNTDSLTQLLFVKNVPFELVDGATAENRELRNKLFDVGLQGRAIDGDKRVLYPQVFFRDPSAASGFKYVGTWESVHRMNEDEGTVDPVSGNTVTPFADTFGHLVGAGAAAAPPGAAPGSEKAAPTEDVTPLATAVHAAAESAASAPHSAVDDTAAAAAAATPAAEGVPQAAAAAAAPAAPAAAPAPAEEQPDEEMKEEAALPAGWEQCTSRDGRVYYANKATKETSWVRPVDGVTGPWREITSSDGRLYYYNTTTGDTQWTKPDDF